MWKRIVASHSQHRRIIRACEWAAASSGLREPVQPRVDAAVRTAEWRMDSLSSSGKRAAVRRFCGAMLT
jgi:hypothetical protein